MIFWFSFIICAIISVGNRNNFSIESIVNQLILIKIYNKFPKHILLMINKTKTFYKKLNSKTNIYIAFTLISLEL